MKIKPIIFGYSWLGIFNICIAQWFFVRLQATLGNDGHVTKFDIIGPIVPCTGWYSPYVYLFRKPVKKTIIDE